MIDFSQLPPPNAITPLDFVAILQQRKTALLALVPESVRADVAVALAYESELLVKLLEESAYRELHLIAKINNAWQASSIAFAAGADLDHVVARVGVVRELITPADPAAIPPTPAVYESDARLRARAQLAPEKMSVAGPDEAYIAHAIDADPRVADAWVYSPAPVHVVVVVLATTGEADATLLASVTSYLRDIKRRPATDLVTTESARIIHATLDAQLELSPNVDRAETIAAARAEFDAQLVIGDAQRRKTRLGQAVTLDMVHAALRRPGVVRVRTTYRDIECARNEAIVFDSINIT